jgi:hypothetical protein
VTSGGHALQACALLHRSHLPWKHPRWPPGEVPISMRWRGCCALRSTVPPVCFCLLSVSPSCNPGYVTSIMGRRRPLPKICAQDQQLRAQAERQAVNFMVQGTGAGFFATFLCPPAPWVWYSLLLRTLSQELPDPHLSHLTVTVRRCECHCSYVWQLLSTGLCL